MVKKSIAVVLALLFFAGIVLGKKKPVKTEEIKEPEKKEVVVQKDADFKDKLSLGYDILNRNVYLRFWPNNKFGMEFTGGLGFATGSSTANIPSSFTFNAGMNMIFPMYNAGTFYLNLKPGIGIGFNNTSYPAVGNLDSYSINKFQVILGCWLEGEEFLTAISKNLSVSSSVGAGFLISSTSDAGTSATTIGFSAALPDFSIMPLVVRYYF